MNLKRGVDTDVNDIGFSLFFVIGLYLILYNPVLVFTGTGVFKPLVAIGVCLYVMPIVIKVLPRLSDNCQLNKYYFERIAKFRIAITPLILFSYYIMALCLCQFIALLSGSDETFSQLLNTSISTLIPLVCLMIAFLPKVCDPVKSMAAMTAFVGSLQSVFIILDAAFPLFRGIFASIVIHPTSLNDSFRAAGLTSSTGDGLSFSQAICGICAFYMLVISKKRLSQIIWSSSFLIIFLSMIPVGRTGIVLLAFFVFFIMAFSGLNIKEKVSLITHLSAISIFAIALAYGLMLLLDPDSIVFVSDVLLPYAFEFVYKYYEGEGLATSSTDDIYHNMIFFPSNDITWLFGDGYFADPAYQQQNYMGTDIGYLRILFYVGLTGSLLIYSWYLIVWIVCCRNCYAKNHKILFSSILGCIMVANLKFPFVLMNAAVCFALLLILVAYHRGNRAAYELLGPNYVNFN